jgi:hypothetical protein
MLEWIKQRAAEARKQETQRSWHETKGRFIESHSDEFFRELTAVMEQAIAAFNEEFPEPEHRIDEFQSSLNRFLVVRHAAPSVRLECRLDYAGNFVRYSYVRAHRWKDKTYQLDGYLEFDLSAKKEVLLHGADQVPMKVEQVTQFLLEPFFEF